MAQWLAYLSRATMKSPPPCLDRKPMRSKNQDHRTGAQAAVPKQRTLLSLFCGAGGLDLGFERAGFKVGLAFDIRGASVASYNHNRPHAPVADVFDVTRLNPELLDILYGREFLPAGVIGGPPCQSFSMANRNVAADDPRHILPLEYAELLAALNARAPVPFFVMENVVGLLHPDHAQRLAAMLSAFTRAGFTVSHHVLDAVNYGVPQRRARVFLVGLNTALFSGTQWVPPAAGTSIRTVKDAIGGLPEPAFFQRNAAPIASELHPNHWCMQPKSAKFARGSDLRPGNGSPRSFKTLHWDRPSFTVCYGHREVHVHPSCRRRLSVYEAMLLQGFPPEYVLLGSMSAQFQQVSEAVPPLLAQAVARSVLGQMASDGESAA